MANALPLSLSKNHPHELVGAAHSPAGDDDFANSQPI